MQFHGHNENVRNEFSYGLRGEQDQVGDVRFHLREDLIAQAIGLPQEGEHWSKLQPIDKILLPPLCKDDTLEPRWGKGCHKDVYEAIIKDFFFNCRSM